MLGKSLGARQHANRAANYFHSLGCHHSTIARSGTGWATIRRAVLSLLSLFSDQQRMSSLYDVSMQLVKASGGGPQSSNGRVAVTNRVPAAVFGRWRVEALNDQSAKHGSCGYPPKR